MEGKLAALGFEQRLELATEAWSHEAVATSAIEGEHTDLPAVRSSVARRLGVAHQGGPNAPRSVEGLLDIMDDAVTRCAETLTHECLQAWQAALFPTGYSGMSKIRVGGYRDHAEPMQIVSGRIGRERVHCEAPPSDRVPAEMGRLLAGSTPASNPTASSGPPWRICGSRPSTRSRTATAASAACWWTWCSPETAARPAA